VYIDNIKFVSALSKILKCLTSVTDDQQSTFRAGRLGPKRPARKVDCRSSVTDVKHFKIFERALINKFGRVMKVLRNDNGKEYCNSQMKQYLQSRRIKHETTAPYTPEQNGKCERQNRTVVECARTMIQVRDMKKSLWAEPINTAAFLVESNFSNWRRRQ